MEETTRGLHSDSLTKTNTSFQKSYSKHIVLSRRRIPTSCAPRNEYHHNVTDAELKQWGSVSRYEVTVVQDVDESERELKTPGVKYADTRIGQTVIMTGSEPRIHPDFVGSKIFAIPLVPFSEDNPNPLYHFAKVEDDKLKVRTTVPLLKLAEETAFACKRKQTLEEFVKKEPENTKPESTRSIELEPVLFTVLPNDFFDDIDAEDIQKTSFTSLVDAINADFIPADSDGFLNRLLGNSEKPTQHDAKL